MIGDPDLSVGSPNDIAPPVRIIGSHTLLSDYENCPKKAYHRYVAKDLPYVETPEMKWGNYVHSAMERRLVAGIPLPDDIAHLEGFPAAILQAGRVEGEQKVACRADWSPCSFFDDDVKWRGKIDVPIYQRPEVVVILDWKTGKVRENPSELRLHAALLKRSRPELERIIGYYVWTKDNALGEPHDIMPHAQTYDRYDKIMAHIEHNAALNHWPARENPLCRWCDVLSCSFNKKGK